MLKIPQSIIDKADKIIKNVRESAELEQEIKDWIISKGIEIDDLGDTLACLMYAEYSDGNDFAEVLSNEMKSGKVL